MLIDKQGNFGSIAGLPPAAMRYTEARLSPVAALMLDDLKLDTVDFIPTYDESGTEPTVLAVASSRICWSTEPRGSRSAWRPVIPPHNLREICDALIRVIDEPDVSIDELMDDRSGSGLSHRRRDLRPQRDSTRLLHGAQHDRGARPGSDRGEHGRRQRIVVTEIPYQQTRDRVVERIAGLVNDGRIKGISDIRDESDLKEPVRLVIDIKRDADPEVVLNQLYQFSPLQDSFSLIFLALVDGKPRELNFKELLEEFIRHRVTVIRDGRSSCWPRPAGASTRSKVCCWRWPTSTRSFASFAARGRRPRPKSA